MKNKKYNKTWFAWYAMLDRCHNPYSKKYINYGKRGIKVCESWHIFENFLLDMGEAPKDLSLDRIDNNKGYYKENCRWATRILQNRNKRSNIIIEFEGLKFTLAEWTRILLITHPTIFYWRVENWGFIRAATSTFYNRRSTKFEDIKIKALNLRKRGLTILRISQIVKIPPTSLRRLLGID